MTTAFVTPNGFGFLVVTVQRWGQEETVTAKDAAIELSALADMSRASHVNAGPHCLAANAAAAGLPTAAVGSNKATLPFFFTTMSLLKEKGGLSTRVCEEGEAKKFFNNSPPIMNTSEVRG